MKRSIARKWANALDSGEYKQCQGQLRKADKWCCLGVLCNLHAQEHPELAATQKKKSKYFGESEVLPHEVIEWAGMRSDVGYIEYGRSLAGLNDDFGWMFSDLAKVIRKEWKKL